VVRKANLFPALLGTLLLIGAPVRAELINEIRPNPPGTDLATQSLELRGTPGAAFSGWFLSIEGDSGSSLGTVDRAEPISGAFDASGLLTAVIGDLENPSFTLALMDSFSGSIGSDIDGDNDGVADDLSTFGTLLDAIGVPDSAGDEATLYGAQLGGVDLAYGGSEPELIFRDRTTLAWYAVNDAGNPTDGVFDLSGGPVLSSDFDSDPTVPSFGTLNPTTRPTGQAPAPATLPLVAAGLLVASAAGPRRRLAGSDGMFRRPPVSVGP
jgi:hypothetical protein